MAGVGFIARLQRRRRWRSLAAIALVLGLGAGAATSLIAGARRSASVVDRYYAKTIPYSAWVLLLVPAALAVAAACSLVPARRARRAHIAQLVRVE
jgi:hypothetical protein